MKKPRFKKAFDKSYREFLLSELLIAIMEKDTKSVRKLANEVGLSPTVIQNIRSGKQSDIKLSNFMSILNAYGYHMVLEKKKEHIVIF
jgi:DNA-binding Xre family transcriptional regulator